MQYTDFMSIFRHGMCVAASLKRNSPPSILLRESYRDNGKVKTCAIANLSHWVPNRIDALRKALDGKLVSVGNDVWLWESSSRALESSLIFEPLPTQIGKEAWAFALPPLQAINGA